MNIYVGLSGGSMTWKGKDGRTGRSSIPTFSFSWPTEYSPKVENKV